MHFANVISTVKSVVEWLESDTDALNWEPAAEEIEQAMTDTERMAKPLRRRDKGFEAAPPQRSSVEGPVSRAMPDLEALYVALESRDRETALEHGRKALSS